MIPGLLVSEVLTFIPFFSSKTELTEINDINSIKPAAGVKSAMFVKAIMVIKIA